MTRFAHHCRFLNLNGKGFKFGNKKQQRFSVCQEWPVFEVSSARHEQVTSQKQLKRHLFQPQMVYSIDGFRDVTCSYLADDTSKTGSIVQTENCLKSSGLEGASQQPSNPLTRNY
jgi:hypothetical protein